VAAVVAAIALAPSRPDNAGDGRHNGIATRNAAFHWPERRNARPMPATGSSRPRMQQRPRQGTTSSSELSQIRSALSVCPADIGLRLDLAITSRPNKRDFLTRPLRSSPVWKRLRAAGQHKRVRRPLEGLNGVRVGAYGAVRGPRKSPAPGVGPGSLPGGSGAIEVWGLSRADRTIVPVARGDQSFACKSWPPWRFPPMVAAALGRGIEGGLFGAAFFLVLRAVGGAERDKL
jgi:hypothetical protein